MINFDKLSPEQLKKYIKPLKLKKMEKSSQENSINIKAKFICSIETEMLN